MQRPSCAAIYGSINAWAMVVVAHHFAAGRGQFQQTEDAAARKDQRDVHKVGGVAASGRLDYDRLRRRVDEAGPVKDLCNGRNIRMREHLARGDKAKSPASEGIGYIYSKCH